MIDPERESVASRYAAGYGTGMAKVTVFMAFGERSGARVARNSENWIITGLRRLSDKERQGIPWGSENGGEWRPVQP